MNDPTVIIDNGERQAVEYSGQPWKRREVIGDAVLYLGDCLEVLPCLGDVDAVISDPPYASGGFTEASKKASNGMGNRSETRARDGWFAGDSMTTGGASWVMRACAASCFELLPTGGTLLFFTDWRMVGHMAPAIESARLRYQNLVVWNKGVAGIGAGFRAQHELAMLFAKGTPRYFNLSFGNVITTAKIPSGDKEHQTEKPVELMASLVRVLSPFGGTVVDPFMGSGTTGVACVQLGRKFVGVEVHEDYFDIACKRIAEAYRQPRLFEEPAPKPVQTDIFGGAA